MGDCQKSDDRVFVLKVDHQDRITAVNENWLAFAVENGGDNLADGSVLGGSLWSHISSDSTRHIYRTLFTKARQEGRCFTVPFRCDSPDCRRFLKMEIVPSADGAVTMESMVIKTEEREHVSLLEPDIDRSDDFISMCSYCKKIPVDDTTWHEVEEAIRILDLLSLEKPPRITHTICPACYDDISKVEEFGSLAT